MADGDPPNILFILADDLGRAGLGTRGAPLRTARAATRPGIWTRPLSAARFPPPAPALFWPPPAPHFPASRHPSPHSRTHRIHLRQYCGKQY
jgi:arylsulfatase A-like enzyme